MNIADNILNYIQSQLTSEASPIDVDSNLMESGRMDSTAMLELILWVGDTFDIAIQNEDLTPENFATPRNIVEFVHRQKSEKVRDLQCDTAA
jgi:acyl carrier protein